MGCERGVHFYAMKFIDGRPLTDVIRPPSDAPRSAQAGAETEPAARAATVPAQRDPGRFRRIAEWGIQAAEALEHAHSLGIVHRDIKPGNLMIDGQGKLWVTDFGLAKLSIPGREAGEITMTGDMVGTLRYMSPEQALAKHGVVDHRTDVYSLGATLYELLTLRPAVAGADKQEILKAIAFEEPTPLRKIDKSIPIELETITLKCLAKNPSERYATAKELTEDLRRWCEDTPIKAKPPGWRERAAKWGRGHQALVRISFGMLVVAVIGLGVSTLLIWREKETTRLAKVEAEARASETNAILEFVEKSIMLAAQPANRTNGLGHDVTLRRALEAALPFVEKNFTEQPLIEARLRSTLGLTFSSLGDEKGAADQLERARDLYSRNLGTEHSDTLNCMGNLANRFYALNRRAEAHKLYEEVLAARKRVLPPDHPQTLKCMLNLATSYFDLNRRAEALKLREETCAAMKRVLPPDHPDTLASMHSLANSYSDEKRLDEAHKLYEEVLAARRRKFPPDHPDILIAMSSLAQSYANLNRHEEALKLHKEVACTPKVDPGEMRVMV